MRSLGELEARIMSLFWEGDASQQLTVHDVVAGLDGRPVAYTTAITVIERLRDKGLLRRRREGRSFRYRATGDGGNYAGQLMAQVYEASSHKGAALLHFAAHLPADDAERLRDALAELVDEQQS